MPYQSIADLPDAVKNHLPEHGQEIYLQAYNHALQEYQDKSKRRTDENLETVSSKVAWAAVKKVYHKNVEGRWVKNDVSD